MGEGEGEGGMAHRSLLVEQSLGHVRVKLHIGGGILDDLRLTSNHSCFTIIANASCTRCEGVLHVYSKTPGQHLHV